MPVKFRIHPAIGVARVGDSPDDFYVGPEAPGIPPTLNKPDGSSAQPGRYKDGQHRIKRQGARFRIYQYTEDDAGTVTRVREITGTEAQIEWEIHLANRKAASPKFKEPHLRRNADRSEGDLVIDAGVQRISGVNQPMKPLRGKFMQSTEVQLGDLLTDAGGRLIVLGGRGKSQSFDGRGLSEEDEDFADNEGWCDDTSDGPIRAMIRLNGAATPIAADPAWVIIAPPDFSPAIENVVTLYDAVYDVMARLDSQLAVTEKSNVSFTQDIFPILRRVSYMHWVSARAAEMHGEGSHLYFISRVDELSSNKQQGAGDRDEIFQALRNPQGGGGDMPKLPPLAAEKAPGASLTKTQYKRMELWKQGKFVADWPGAEPPPTPFDNISEKDRPQALDRAALEACVGGPFFPGIEASRVMLDPKTYDRKRPFRINETLVPGTLTAGMAVPWQSDFHDCNLEDGGDWWPGQRPNQVQRALPNDTEWMPPDWTRKDMVENWMQLGFVVPKAIASKVQYVVDETLLQPQSPTT
jgi:hypothetical protein